MQKTYNSRTRDRDQLTRGPFAVNSASQLHHTRLPAEQSALLETRRRFPAQRRRQCRRYEQTRDSKPSYQRFHHRLTAANSEFRSSGSRSLRVHRRERSACGQDLLQPETYVFLFIHCSINNFETKFSYPHHLKLAMLLTKDSRSEQMAQIAKPPSLPPPHQHPHHLQGRLNHTENSVSITANHSSRIPRLLHSTSLRNRRASNSTTTTLHH